jgi:branched-chain amino acid transport system permease protein
MTQDIQILLDSVALGSIYALMAIGIGLVFGVLRLVNFAYGQLIMAGGYAIALTSDRSPAVSIAVCLAVVLALSLAMELAAFRPLRRSSASPMTMLVATFAISYLLQSIALVKFGAIGKFAVLFPELSDFVTIGGLSIRWITLVSIGMAVVVLSALALLLGRTTIGLQMRAASIDPQTARLLGVRANRVITLAVLIAGVLAAIVAVILPMAQSPLVAPDFGLRETIIVLVGVVVGGIDRLLSATLGGFTMGLAVGLLSGYLPSTGSWPFTSSVYLDSAVFMLVIVVLLLRPAGLFAPPRQSAVERV